MVLLQSKHEYSDKLSSRVSSSNKVLKSKPGTSPISSMSSGKKKN